MVGDYVFPVFRDAFGHLRGFAAAETALSVLAKLGDQDKDGEACGRLKAGEDGFHRLLAVIHGRRDAFRSGDGTRTEYDTGDITEIVCTRGVGYSQGEGQVNGLYVSLRREGRTVPDVVATFDRVEEWLSTARSNFSLFFGFSLILLGFLLGVPHMWPQDRLP